MHLVVKVFHFVGGFVHHAQHGQATCTDEADHKDGGENKEENVEDGGIVPVYAPGNGNDVAMLWNDAEGREQEFDNVACCRHGDVKREQDVAHNLPAVVFAIDVENGQDNQVGEDKADHTAKADAAAPEHSRQWHVANRADKADNGDQRTYQRPLYARSRGIAAQEKGAPEGIRHPRRQRTSNEQASTISSQTEAQSITKKLLTA